ncbi:MAG: TetR/AcrR family transcriptional regulator [Lautropia sp.]
MKPTRPKPAARPEADTPVRAAAVRPVTRRLSQQARRQMIIEQAIRFFAEKGFGATTRDLAARIGVAQPLIFQHFPTKSDLVEAVFDALFARMSSYDWFTKLTDRNVGLRARLIDFFQSYATTLYDYDWIRIYMFAGLEGGAFNRLCITRLSEPLLREVIRQIRIDAGARGTSLRDVTSREVELLWILHGGLYYSAIRKQIYGMAIESTDVRPLIEYGVDSALFGIRKLIADLEAAEDSGATAPAPAPTDAQQTGSPATGRRAGKVRSQGMPA